MPGSASPLMRRARGRYRRARQAPGQGRPRLAFAAEWTSSERPPRPSAFVRLRWVTGSDGLQSTPDRRPQPLAGRAATEAGNVSTISASPLATTISGLVEHLRAATGRCQRRPRSYPPAPIEKSPSLTAGAATLAEESRGGPAPGRRPDSVPRAPLSARARPPRGGRSELGPGLRRIVVFLPGTA